MYRYVFGFAVLFLVSGMLWAATPAGTLIRNQAIASYTDSDGQRVNVTSNMVETLIQQVAGVNLTADQSRRASPGSLVSFSHRLYNTGNTNDRFALVATNTGGSVSLGALSIFADANEDGVADSTVPLTISPLIAAGDDFMVVVQGSVPASGIDGDTAQITLTATSEFDASQSVQNTDLVTVGIGAAISVLKSISQSAGFSPDGPFRITLSYENSGDQAAGDLTLIDALPPGLSYVPGSGRWSGVSAALTDANPSDSQSDGATSIAYCAYDASCSSLAEAEMDPDNSSLNQVTAIIDLVAAGASGEVSFEIAVDNGLDAGFIQNIAEFEYDIAIGAIDRQFSNTVSFEVLASAAVVANGSTATSINGMNEPVSVASVAKGGTVRFDNIIWNTGNATDTFNIEVDAASSTFPAGTLWQLLRDDGSSVLTDTNNDGVVDTGPVNPGAFSRVVMQLQLPDGVAGNNAGLGYDLVKRARSVSDSTVFDDVTDHLDEIIGNVVDLTNQSAAGTPGALGVGPGPEATPVSTVPVNSAGVASIDLYIRHQGSTPDSYQLHARGDAAGGPTPSGWQVSFRDAANQAAIVSTGVLASGSAKHVIADIQLPAGVQAGTQSIWFEVVSATSGASDIKHDALSIATSASLSLLPGLSARLEAGGTVVYEHVLANNGNTVIDDIILSLLDSRPDWSSVVYLDTNEDGALDAGDQAFSTPLILSPGESISLFVKVFAPANATNLQRNTTTVSAHWQSNTELAQVQDQSTVNRSNVVILKEQAVDIGCDGVPDDVNGFSVDQIEVAPGNNCVVYRLTATNRGADASYNVKIHDYTPPYTLYMAAASCSRVPCWLVEPVVGEAGSINAETDQLLPGDSFFLQFVVRIE